MKNDATTHIEYGAGCPDCATREVGLPQVLPAVGDDFDWDLRDFDGFRLRVLILVVFGVEFAVLLLHHSTLACGLLRNGRLHHHCSALLALNHLCGCRLRGFAPHLLRDNRFRRQRQHQGR